MYYAHYDVQTGQILGFYTPDIHGDNIPTPNIQITTEQWQDYLNNQSRRKVDVTTQQIVACEPPAPTIDVLIASIRAQRNCLLAQSDWTQLPDVPLADEQRQQWRAYRQALRDFPATCDPQNPVWPEQPV